MIPFYTQVIIVKRADTAQTFLSFFFNLDYFMVTNIFKNLIFLIKDKNLYFFYNSYTNTFHTHTLIMTFQVYHNNT